MPLTRDHQKELYIKNKLEKPNIATYEIDIDINNLILCFTKYLDLFSN